jgi:hypothetical protein
VGNLLSESGDELLTRVLLAKAEEGPETVAAQFHQFIEEPFGDAVEPWLEAPEPAPFEEAAEPEIEDAEVELFADDTEPEIDGDAEA